MARVFSGGSTNLRPEIADTWTGGIVLSPDFVPRLRFPDDYYDIKIEDATGMTGA